MPDEFKPAWAAVVRDFSPVEGEEAGVVRVLKVLWSRKDAVAEVRRLREDDSGPNRLYYCEATEAQTR